MYYINFIQQIQKKIHTTNSKKIPYNKFKENYNPTIFLSRVQSNLRSTYRCGVASIDKVRIVMEFTKFPL